MGSKKLKSKDIVFTAVMWILALMMLYPFIMMIAISFRPSGQAYQPLFATGIMHTLRSYKQVLSHPNFGDWYRNTIVTVVVTIAIRLVITILAAYSFSRLHFKGKALILAFLVATMMVPGETTMVPRYLYFKEIGILNTLWSIVLPEASEVFYLILLIEFFSSIPGDFTEAATIDGAGHLLILSRIFIPLSGPAIATTVLFSFINIWNNYLDPYLFINNIETQLITPALQFFQEQGGANMPVQMAGSALALIPVIILFVFTQKYFVQGVASSGIKG